MFHVFPADSSVPAASHDNRTQVTDAGRGLDILALFTKRYLKDCFCESACRADDESHGPSFH